MSSLIKLSPLLRRVKKNAYELTRRDAYASMASKLTNRKETKSWWPAWQRDEAAARRVPVQVGAGRQKAKAHEFSAANHLTKAEQVASVHKDSTYPFVSFRDR